MIKKKLELHGAIKMVSLILCMGIIVSISSVRGVDFLAGDTVTIKSVNDESYLYDDGSDKLSAKYSSVQKWILEPVDPALLGAPVKGGVPLYLKNKDTGTYIGNSKFLGLGGISMPASASTVYYITYSNDYYIFSTSLIGTDSANCLGCNSYGYTEMHYLTSPKLTTWQNGFNFRWDLSLVDSPGPAIVANKTKFSTALAAVKTPAALTAIINDAAYNAVDYLVDYPSTTNSVFTKIQGFLRYGANLEELKTLLSEENKTNLNKFLTSSQQAAIPSVRSSLSQAGAMNEFSASNSSAIPGAVYFSEKWKYAPGDTLYFTPIGFREAVIVFSATTDQTGQIYKLAIGRGTNGASPTSLLGSVNYTGIGSDVSVGLSSGTPYWITIFNVTTPPIDGYTFSFGTVNAAGQKEQKGSWIVPKITPQYFGFGGWVDAVAYRNISVFPGLTTVLNNITEYKSAAQLSAMLDIVKTAEYNNVIYQGERGSGGIYDKINGFYVEKAYLVLSDVKDLLTFADGKSFLKDDQKAGIKTALLQVTDEVYLVNYLTSTLLGLGKSTDVWPDQKTMFSIVKYNNFDSASLQNAKIYEKIKSFYIARATATLPDIKDLLSKSMNKKFLTAGQQLNASNLLDIVKLEIALESPINDLNLASNKLVGINTFLSTNVRDTNVGDMNVGDMIKKLRKQKAALVE